MPCTLPCARTAAAFAERIAQPGSEEPDERAVVPVRAALLQRLHGFGHERGPEEQILGRISGDGQLGEDDEVGAGRRRGLVRVEDPGGVPLEIADERSSTARRPPAPSASRKLIGRDLPNSLVLHRVPVELVEMVPVDIRDANVRR